MRNIIFIGGGHSNTIAIRNLMQKIYSLQSDLKNEILDQNKFHLISEYKHSAYSGMIPGSICGYYDNQESYIDLEKFSEIHKCNFINEKVIEILPKEGKILFEKKQSFEIIQNDIDIDITIKKNPFHKSFIELKFDLLSINVGSKTFNNGKVKGVEEFSIQTRPISDLLQKIQNFEKKIEHKLNQNSNIKIVIVGSGVAGIELGFSMLERFKKNYGNINVEIFIISNNEDLIQDFEPNVNYDLFIICQQKNINIIKNSECLEITDKGVFYKEKTNIQNNNCNNNLEKREFLDCDLVIWATGAGAQELNFKSNLGLDSRGFILVKDSLQSLDYKNIFGAGDCVQLEKFSINEKDENFKYRSFPRKSGVYAVREGAILAENIFKYLLSKEDEFLSYNPQTKFLKLITLGDEEAFGTKFGISFRGKWVWNLKKHIDVNFVKMFEKDIDLDLNIKGINEQKITSSCDTTENNCKNEKFDNVDPDLNNNRFGFVFSPENCLNKLKYSCQDYDFQIQLKILDKLNSEENLLNEILRLL